MPDAPVLEVRGLTVEYLTDAGPVRAVDRFDLDIVPGEFVGVVGESGCGKSTMLFGIAQLLSPPARVSEGSVRFRGHDLVTMTDRQLATTRWRDLSVVMQSAMNALNPVAQLGDQFADAMRAHGERSRATIRQRSEEVLALVGIDLVHLKSYPHQLSGGMRKRTAVAQAWIVNPDILLMDEPFSALDVQTRQIMENELLALWQESGKAVVFITHDLDEAIALSDEVVILGAGPGSTVVGSYEITIPRPRDLLEIRDDPRFIELHREIWGRLRIEVSKTYQTSALGGGAE